LAAVVPAAALVVAAGEAALPQVEVLPQGEPMAVGMQGAVALAVARVGQPGEAVLQAAAVPRRLARQRMAAVVPAVVAVVAGEVR
jgi:hypothetical protein